MQHNLLDTHAFIWYLNGDNELSNRARIIIEANDAINFISIVSLWEIAIKITLNKLELKTSFGQLSNYIKENGFEILPVTFADTLTVLNFPLYHRDPFDRMIAAQALNNKLTIVSKDKSFNLYNVPTTWQ